MIDSKKIIDAALFYGCDFVEVFVEDSVKLSLSLDKDDEERSSLAKEVGAGIRIFKNGQSRYAHTSQLEINNLLEVTKGLCANAYSEVEYNESIESLKLSAFQYQKDQQMSLGYKEKRAFLEQCHAYADYNKILALSCRHYDEKRHIHIMNSEGVNVSQHIEKTRLLVRATAEVNGVKKTCYAGPAASQGIALYDTLDLKALIESVSESAGVMASAKPIQSGKMAVVIDNGFGGLFFHEACGHSLEAKAIARNESEFSGCLGQQVASEKVTLVDDGSIRNAWGSQKYDDEGTETKKNVLIEKGRLKSFLIDKYSGQMMGMQSTGSSRRESYKFAPTSRMSNTFLLPGTDKTKDIISNTEHGLFVKSIDAGSVNPVTGAFNFSILEGYEILNGKVTRPVRGATLVGKGSDAIMNVDMVSSDFKMGQGFCYDKSGTLFIEAGQPTIRIKEMIVGGLG